MSTPAVEVGERTERLATVAVVLAVLSVLFSALIVPGVLAVVCGVLARRTPTDAGRRSPKATVGIVVGTITVVAGVAVWVTNAPTIFESPSYRTLRVGDCYERPDNDPRFIAPQSCQGQHGREVVAVLDDPAARGLSYPGLEAIRRVVDPLCRAAAEDYVSGSLDQAPLRVFRIYPSRESWNDGNRRVVCALGSKDRRPLVGSLRNRRLAAS